jgi:hypothetical protein
MNEHRQFVTFLNDLKNCNYPRNTKNINDKQKNIKHQEDYDNFL